MDNGNVDNNDNDKVNLDLKFNLEYQVVEYQWHKEEQDGSNHIMKDPSNNKHKLFHSSQIMVEFSIIERITCWTSFAIIWYST